MSSIPSRSSYLEDREQTTWVNWILQLLMKALVLGNVKRETREIRNPRYAPPADGASSGTNDEPELLTIDEGTAFHTDPITLWFSFAPMAGGLVSALSAIPMHPLHAIPWLIGGGIAFVWGVLWFVLFTEMAAPLTLYIRQITGTTYLVNCRVTVFPKWIRDVLGIVIVRIPGARGITVESDQNDPENLLRSNMSNNESGDQSGNTNPPVLISFDGVFIYGFDIRCMHTLKMMFFDDYLAHPPEPGDSIAEDMKSRCRRLIQPVIYAACDPILQPIDWRRALTSIGEINKALLNELPVQLEHLAIHFESILLSAAYGTPIEQLTRATDAQLASDTDRRVAESNKLAEVAKANAAAEIAEAQANSDKRARVANEVANREAGIAKQEADLAIATRELETAKMQLEVERQRADIKVAPLIARLAAINTQQSATLLDSLTALEPAQRLAVWTQLMASLGTAPVPGTIVSVANGEGLDSYPTPALVNALAPILQGFQRMMNPSGSTPPSASPPSGT